MVKKEKRNALALMLALTTATLAFGVPSTIATHTNCGPSEVVEPGLAGYTEIPVTGQITGSSVTVPANEKWVFSDDFAILATSKITVAGALVGHRDSTGRGADLTLDAPTVTVLGYVTTISGESGGPADSLLVGSAQQYTATPGQRGGDVLITGDLVTGNVSCLGTGSGGDGGDHDNNCDSDVTDGAWVLAALGDSPWLQVNVNAGDGGRGGSFLFDKAPEASNNDGEFSLGNGGLGGNAVMQGYAPPGVASVEVTSGRGGQSGMPLHDGTPLLSSFATSAFSSGGHGGDGGDAEAVLNWGSCSSSERPECEFPYVVFDGVLWTCGGDGANSSNIVEGCAAAGVDGEAGADGSSGAEAGIFNGRPGHRGEHGGDGGSDGHPGANVGGATAQDGEDGYNSGGDGGTATAQAQCGGRGGNGGDGGDGGEPSCGSIGCDDYGPGGDGGDGLTAGGDGGSVVGDAKGGNGGDAFNGVGGHGGDAISTGGDGGDAGDSGHGGSGCGPGEGGESGTDPGSGGSIAGRNAGFGGSPSGSSGSTGGGVGSAGVTYPDRLDGNGLC